ILNSSFIFDLKRSPIFLLILQNSIMNIHNLMATDCKKENTINEPTNEENMISDDEKENLINEIVS
ncbi:22423_t:CDS:1, partial [Cetraspora pellucida]